MEFLLSIFEPVKSLGEAAGKWFGYINSLDANMNNLKRKIDDLSSQEYDINNELSSAEQRSRKRRKKVVENWLRDVQKLKADVETLQTQEHEVVGWKNVIPRLKLGKLVMEKIEEVEKLQENGRFSNDLLIDDPTSGRLIPTTASFGESTRARNVEKVWEYLMDDEIRRIGVYGMGGVGKTTIMYHIQNQLLNETRNFDDVIWVTVSKAFDSRKKQPHQIIRKLQRVIAKKLDLKISNYEEETGTASELFKMLSQRKRYVLILDDLWEEFPLDKVGIPEPTKDNGCKLVLTTRSLEVCRKMKCREIKVELLTEEEALNLFMSTVEGHPTVLAPDVKKIAAEVSKKCARLPLAIVSIAGSMRGVNDIHQWRNALNGLISSTKEIWDNESVVFEQLKFSYSRLKDEKLQHCFLYCAFYPEDHSIPREHLIKYWIAEGLIAEMKSTETMFDKGHTILDKLINTCLLEISTDLGNKKCVRMHDLIRDMALKITSTSPRFMVRASEELVRVPYEDWSEDLERVSLMWNNVVELLSRPPICPHLTTLLLRSHELLNYSKVLRIPDPFFMQMPRLKVLDLSFTDIKSLPKSTTKLENLHTLLLDGCTELKDVPSLEKLKALKELKLTQSQIEEVPQGIEELVNLRNLDISQNYRLHIFPCWKLCRLIQLQELRIWKTKVEVSAEELLSLTQLKVLEAQFHNSQELTNYVRSQQWQNLKTYNLVVGIVDDLRRWKYSSEATEVCFNSSKNLKNIGVDSVVLPRDIEGLEIRKWNNIISLSDIQSLRDARDLIGFNIIECDGLESMFSSSSSFSEDYQIPLKLVEGLKFFDLPNFRVVFDGVVPPHNISFNLKILEFRSCPRMKNIFPAKLLPNFPNLEKLIVLNCENVEEIIAEVETSNEGHHQDNNNTITLRNFKRLQLYNLPRLNSIYKGIMACESLGYISVLNCPMVRRLPLSLAMDGDGEEASALASASASASAPAPAPAPAAHTLQYIIGQEEWWESLEWDDSHTKTTLQPFFTSFTGDDMSTRICAGCKVEIGHGRILSCMGAVWHPECFRCHACDLPISEAEFSMSDNRQYHKSCYKEEHHPRCDVCKNFIPTNADGLIEYRMHPFWQQKYCPSHERDGTPRCFSCERMEPRDTRYLVLDDGRKLCLECLDSTILETHECQPLYLEIQDFYEGLNMKMEQQIPLLLVERQALNDATEGEKNGHHHLPETRGLYLSEEQTVSTILRRPRIGGSRITDMFTETCRPIGRCEVTAILVLYGLPRLLTGSILAHEMMHAWLRLKGYHNLSPDVEEGICQVLAHMWLISEIVAGSASNVASTLSSSPPSPSSVPSSSKKGKCSDFEKKLGEFFKHQIESDTSAAHGDGFRAANLAVNKYGLRRTLDHIKLTTKFPL